MPAAIRRQTFTLLIALIALVVSSCGEDAAMKNTITIQEANQRVKDYMSRARVAFPPSAQFALQSQFKSSPCDDPTDNGRRGRLIASRGYQVAELQPDQFPQHFDAIRAWWGGSGFTVSHDSAHGADRTLGAENAADGLTMSLRMKHVGELFLNASSPCVWPNGSPEPSS
jgi:hypothetical protein